MGKETVRVHVRLDQNLVERCDASLELANARSRNELICDAIKFYLYYLNREDDGEYLAPAMKRIIMHSVEQMEERIGEQVNRMAISQQMMLHILAEKAGYDTAELEQLQQECVDEVSRINGSL